MPATTAATRAKPAPPDRSDVAATLTATSTTIWTARIPPRASTYCSPCRMTTRTCQMTSLEAEADRDEDRDRCEVAEHDPFHEWKPAIEGKPLRKHDAEEHQRGRHDARKEHMERGIQRLKESLPSEQSLHAAATADEHRKAQQHDQQQPCGSVADAHGSHPEAERNTNGRHHDDAQRKIDIG